MYSSHQRISCLAGIAFMFLLGGCALPVPSNAYTGGATRLIRTELYFGNLGPGLEWIPESEWERFVKEEVEPVFPDGFTILRGDGHWLDQTGRAVNEAVHVLLIVHPADRLYFERINQVVARYKSRFQQEAVMQISEKVKVGFHP